jgi:ADP-ribosyl-[dinitrogen reductase] hydrolase
LRQLIDDGPSLQDRFRGCLLGGAVGDALGAPVEFSSRTTILNQFGPSGIRDYAPAYGRKGAITDDTQMTLFTAEGFIRAAVRYASRGICNPVSVIHRAYLRWLRMACRTETTTRATSTRKHLHCGTSDRNRNWRGRPE